MKENGLENDYTGQHQQVLDILQKDLVLVNEQVLNLRGLLENGREELTQLVRQYQRERYQRQEEIWQSRCLTRCTSCYKIPPGHAQSTPWGGWGLIPLDDDAHYIEIRGNHTHRGDHYGSDSTHSHLQYHRLCTHCYNEELVAYASGGGGLRGISTEQVDEINVILSLEQDKYQTAEALMKRFGNFNEIRVYWHRLPIPEQAYEIGKAINLDDDYKNVLRMVSLKP